MIEHFEIIKIFFLSTITFVAAILLTPLLTNILDRLNVGKSIRNDGTTPIYSKLHAKKAGTPAMGGILIWGTVLLVTAIFFLLSVLTDDPFWQRMNFLSRSQTWLPLGALFAAALVGLLDDIYNVLQRGSKQGGLRVSHRLVIYTLIAIIGAYWFFFKLDFTAIHVPFIGDFDIGWWYIPVFIFIIVATSFSVNETDGLDGLAGGVLLTAFAGYGAIAFAQERFQLATLCIVIAGALLAFLWFNIQPARFFMGDTGSMSLGVTLGIVAMLTNTVFLLPIIGIVFVLESFSVIVQVLSKKIRHKKVFLSAPIHHHFEAKGWPESRIVMRFWVISGVFTLIGVVLFLIDQNF
ncbi:MAG: phospho-N-acetylmuramoyl-pentapeptide-transferase [Patescibacteria group bacterium]|jgi:phospho-N-acetylmuramoyl-pentapeptide-transferase